MRSIVMVVEADDRAAARSAANNMVQENPVIRGTTEPITLELQVPLLLGSDEGVNALESAWDSQLQGYLDDIDTIAAELKTYQDDGFSAAELLEDLDFRAACNRLGALEGFPVQVYGPMADGVVWPSNMESLKQGMPDSETGEPLWDLSKLWVVVVHIS